MGSVDYIFCITTGRSGSDYLSTLFGHVEDCAAFHEPDPQANGRAMRRFSLGDREPMQKVVEQKLAAIRELKGNRSVYVETNHCFIKGFGWLFAERLPPDRMGVIILKRDKSKIARSLLRIGCSPLDPFGRRWVLAPDARDPAVAPPSLLGLPRATYLAACALKYGLRKVGALSKRLTGKELPTPRRMLSYELRCLEWYVEETEARARAFRQRFPTIRYYEVDIESLNSLDEVRRMLTFLDCTPKASLPEVVGNATNLKSHRVAPALPLAAP
jgi:hypothetical protein